MMVRWKAAIQAVVVLGLALGLGLQTSCSCNFCDSLASQGGQVLAPDASYTDAVTTVGTALSVVPTRTGAPITSAAVSTGTVPPGMALQSDGRIVGTPTQTGVFSLQIQLCNQGQCILRPVVITVNAVGRDPIQARYTDASTMVGSPLTVPPTVIQGGPAVNATLARGTLPPGMNLHPTTGTIAGTPTLAGVYSSATAFTNASGATVTAPVTITVSPTGSTALSGTYTNATGTVGTALMVSPTITVGGPVVSASLASGSIPPGMTLQADGSLSGTPSTAGTFTAFITLRNGSGALTTQPVTITVQAAGSTALGAQYTDVTTIVGSAVTVTPSLSAGGPITSAQLANGSLPPGLVLNSDGTVTGTATATGVYTMMIQLGNGKGGAITVPLTITVNNLALGLSYPTPRTFVAGSAIATQTPTLTNPASGQTTTFAVSAGSLPAGLALQADGTITGTPTTPGLFTFTVAATNGSRTASATAIYTVESTALLGLGYATPLSFPAGTAIATQTPSLTNATPGVTSAFAITAGTLPAGLSLNADGTITGTPTTPGVYTFTVTVTNGTRTASASATYTVDGAAPLGLGYATPQTFTAGTAIATQSPTVTNGTPGVTTAYAISGGSLPAGLTLNGSGTITGTPTTPGVYTFTVTATAGTRTASASLSYTVTPSGSLTVNYATPQSFPAGTAIPTQTPAVTNGTPGVTTTFAISGGTLPPGLTLNSNGTIAGTPTTPGVYTFTVTATNGARTATATPTYTVEVAAALSLSYPSPLTFPAGTAIANQTPTVSNGTPGVTSTFAITGGTLPSGLTLATNGTISGTPTVPGVYAFTVTATNGTRTAAATATYTVEVAAALGLGYPTPQSFTAGAAIATQTPTVTNGTPGLTSTYAITNGSLPAGLSLNTNGTITGTPTVPGVYTFTVTATNGTRTASATPTYTVEVTAALGLSYPSPQTFTAGTAIATQTPTVSNGTPGVTSTFALTSGNLPAGLSLATNGTITGTPTTPGVYTFTVTATNGTRTATFTATYTVEPATALGLTYATPQTFTVGTAIGTQTPTVSNGTPGLSSTFAVTNGNLPAGLTLNSTGTITGTPTAIGVTTFTVTVTNGTRTASQILTYTVNAVPPSSLNYASPNTYTVGTAIANNLPNPAGGTPTAYAVLSGTLPAGLSLDPTTGVLSGTPTTAGGPVTVIIRGTNSGGYAEQTLTFTVVAAPTASLSANPSTVPVGQSSSLTALFTGAANGTAVVSGGNLSSPVTLSSGTSLPTGIENSPTSYTYTLTVTNAAGQTVTSTAIVQWIPVPADTWTVTIPQTGGGPFTPGAGNLLNGQIAITAPSQGQSTCGSVTLTVNKEGTLPGSILASARDYSNTFNIASNLGYPFRVPITITLAYDPTLASPNLGASDLPVPFYWDPSYNKWVATGFKSIDTVNHTVTFTTLQPGRYAVLGIPGLALATQSLGFTNATDDWRQNNPSVYDLPGGASLGMGSFASWYFPFRKVTNGNVGLYNLFPSLTDANAEALISRIANGTMDSWGALWSQSAYSLTDKQTGLALITGLMITGQPQIFLMGDARPAVNTAVATAVFGYNATTSKFNVMDPNYPGNALTITWNATSGAFSAYDRAAGYAPALAKFAFEGQTSIHRLADYDRVLSGASTGFPAASFATVSVDSVGSVASPDLSQTITVASASNVVVSGTITNGDENATTVFWSQNGSAPRTAVTLTPVDATHSSFSFTIPALADPYGTTVALETSATPCDPTFSHSGFQKFVVKQASLTPWFPNSCFENSATDPSPWQLEQGSNNAIYYPASPTWNTTTGVMNSYAVSWSASSIDSAIVHVGNDPYVPSIPMVLDGANAFRVNNSASGAHISRIFQTITVPTTVAMPKLSFYWAAALEDNGHPASQQPYVDILVQDVSNSYEVLYYKHFYAGDPSYPGWITGSNGPGNAPVKGIPWQKVNLYLGAGRGNHQLKITITAADCTQTGHGGVAYVDNIGCQ